MIQTAAIKVETFNSCAYAVQCCFFKKLFQNELKQITSVKKPKFQISLFKKNMIETHDLIQINPIRDSCPSLATSRGNFPKKPHRMSNT